MFQGIKFTAFDKDLNMHFIGAMIVSDTFRNPATSASTTKTK
ncbi:hypothetical protein [Maliponia aquimaris]|nr:hypothetical protein [Maliponia aquimaris]